MIGAQALLRRRIANLERIQEQRIEMIEQRKADWDDLIDAKEREIANLKTGLTIGVAK